MNQSNNCLFLVLSTLLFVIISASPHLNNDILYSVYQYYQTTFTPNYIRNNILQLTNTGNHANLPDGPSNIFIIRHGEKNNNGSPPTDQNTYYTINNNGVKRSIELPNFINKLGSDGTPITAIVTCNPSMDYITEFGNVTIRPQTTIFLSAYLLNIPLYIFSNSNVSQPYDATTAINIFTNQTFRGKNILIVFEHKSIQSLTNQIVQCYNYFKQGGTVQNLNNSTLYNVSTQSWWHQNTPIGPKNQYVGLQPNQGTPVYPIPYKSYSQYLPYWNTNSFDKVYRLSQTKPEHNLTIDIFDQNIDTGVQSCNLLIGLLQYVRCWDLPLVEYYKNEDDCLPPER